ncbi:histidyl-tRNA synthetase [Lachnospiraceae bacterium KH1T2]|nr:histidyl-tRNA synthetase [Lachnospiraceae bacterium KH1T2]
MALLKKPVTGMKDILPREMEIRNYVMDLVRETYGNFGFTQIETPCVEHIENLCSNQGGENEKLIFKILKRGEKLDIANAKDSSDLADSGLRYDLTLPLSRYYANHANELPSPFKALQMGNVFRADRPQKGRFRQFQQCDIDILGDATSLAEIELVSATTTLLTKLGFKNFTVRISDRRFLKGIAACCGFEESEWDTVFIILDKMDKIGADGVKEELLKEGYNAESVEKCMSLFVGGDGTRENVLSLKERLGDFLAEGTAESLISIIDCVNASKAGDFSIKFDPTLVRGMSYYTGTIFEIEAAEFSSSIAGGGRYDGMVGRFTGKDVPACGFSIGFERIITMLLDADFKVPAKGDKVAFLVDKKMSAEGLVEVMKEAASLRAEGKKVLVTQMMKNKKFQKDNLEADGYTTIKDFYNK